MSFSFLEQPTVKSTSKKSTSFCFRFTLVWFIYPHVLVRAAPNANRACFFVNDDQDFAPVKPTGTALHVEQFQGDFIALVLEDTIAPFDVELAIEATGVILEIAIVKNPPVFQVRF
jgi:hypothetical protein